MSKTIHDSNAFAASIAAVKCSECGDGPKPCVQMVLLNLPPVCTLYPVFNLCIEKCLILFAVEIARGLGKVDRKVLLNALYGKIRFDSSE